MHKSFVIKVSDLLKNLGKSDTIEFEGLHSGKIPNLTEKGISGTIQLQAINSGTVLVELEEIEAYVNDISDLSGKPFERKIFCTYYTTKFVTDFTEEDGEKREVYDEEFPIDSKSETIDLEDAIVQAIILEEPLVKLAPGEVVEGDDDEMDYFDYEDEQHMGGKVTFS